MIVRELEDLIEETRKLSRASDKAQLNMALGVLEVARQLAILNEQLASRPAVPVKTAVAGKKK
jgi:hypothetical protein